MERQLSENKDSQQTSKKKGAKPKIQLKMKVSTWEKQSHGLYDYQSENSKINIEDFLIKEPTIVMRGSQSRKTYLKQIKSVPENNKEYPNLARILEVFQLVYDNKTKKYTLNNRLKEPQPNVFMISAQQECRNALFRSIWMDPAKPKGFKLSPGDYVKLGRVQLRVIEIHNEKKTLSIDYQQAYGSKQFIFQIKQSTKGSCKICLDDSSTQSDPLIGPCLCKGSCGAIHLDCLKNWINNKVKKEMLGKVLTYNFQKFSCQICQAPFPSIIKLQNGEEAFMLNFQKPQIPYILFQQCCQSQKSQAKTVHFVMPTKAQPVRIGRGNICELNITDISVSRTHAQIKYQDNGFMIYDNNSKFGTLIQIKQPLKIQGSVKIQYDGCIFDIEAQQIPKNTSKKSLQKNKQQKIQV